MTMPASNQETAMDEKEAAEIEAEIAFELQHINIDVDDLNIGTVEDEDANWGSEEDETLDVPTEVSDYLSRIQDQSARFERELEECDDLLNHSYKPPAESNAVIPYDDHQLLLDLAAEHGCDPEQYKLNILEEIEKDEAILVDELAEFIDNAPIKPDPDKLTESGVGKDDTALQIVGLGGDDMGAAGDGIAVAISKAVEEGVDTEDASYDLAPASRDPMSQTTQADIQRALQDQLDRLEQRYTDRAARIKQEEAYKRDEESVRQRRVDEARAGVRAAIAREELGLQQERELAQRQVEQEQADVERDIEASRRHFEEEMVQLQAEADKQKRELDLARCEEERRQMEKQNTAALKIQMTYRGHRVRSEYGPVLLERKKEWKRQKDEERLVEIQKEIDQREEQKQRELEQEREKKEEEKRQKELEKQQKEEEKRRKKEEEERIKQEQKRMKEEEKRQKKEEEKRKKEEEKQRKEDEEQRKREEKRQKEEEEKRKKEEQKRLKEEEKRRKQEEDKRMKEDKKLKEENDKREAEERKKIEEERQKIENAPIKNDGETKQHIVDLSTKNVEKSASDQTQSEANTNKSEDTQQQDIQSREKAVNEALKKESNANNGTFIIDDNTKQQSSENKGADTKSSGKGDNPLPSSRTPRPPSARKRTPRDARKSADSKPPVNGEAAGEPADCLPAPQEALRLNFIKECMPWSKISNEPWKLKAVSTRKPLRRPSSTKKLPPLEENVIIQAARVASLKQVTTVQLSDLPGNNIGPLGQCWGLKYLSMRNCSLVALDGLHQCKQLEYIDVKENIIEYVDLKDIGKLQYLDVSCNKLASIHGLDSCTNLRWLDVSRNNITRLGGLETLRRLHTLKISHNQLITTKGLGDTPTLQVLDFSHNHLQGVTDLDKLCLLLILDVSSNNLLNVPNLKNQVLMQELSLADNSITSLDILQTTWLPLLQKLRLGENNLSDLPMFQSCLLLRDLDLSNNQLLDAEAVCTCLKDCKLVENLDLEENPVLDDLNNSFCKKLHSHLPRLQGFGSSPSKSSPLKPRNSFEAMCLTQAQVYRDIRTHFDSDIRSLLNGNAPKGSDLAKLCDVYFKFCDKTFKIAVEHRYAHEYGEVTVAMPTAPTTPKTGKPLSSRQKIVPKDDVFINPKEMFENALKSSNKPAIAQKPNLVSKETSSNVLSSAYANPKDLFEQALKSQNPSADTDRNSSNINKLGQSEQRNVHELANGYADKNLKVNSGNDINIETNAAIKIQAAWRGWMTRHEIEEHTKLWLSAITIQANWKGYLQRRRYRQLLKEREEINQIDPRIVEELHSSATKIQAAWRGYSLRKKLFAALEYAQFVDDDDEDMMELGDEFDFDKFVDIDTDLLDNDWKPPDTPDIPSNHPILKKPPSGKAKIPPINTGDYRPPSNPRRAWKNMESPLSDIQNPLGRIPRPPSSVLTETDTHRTSMTRKEEKLSEDWGFKDSSTAHLMMQRAKKMKYNAERRRKISKLDPKQRLALFRKLEEVTHHEDQYHVQPTRKTLPRKEYFQARQEEVDRKDHEKREEYQTRASRIYEWLHMPVGDHTITDSVINRGLNHGKPLEGESNLPKLDADLHGRRRVQLVSSPLMDLQSIDSISSAGEKCRRFSAGSGYSATSKLPPIQSGSAPAVRAKEKMSWRSKPVNQSSGWGGGKKRGDWG